MVIFGATGDLTKRKLFTANWDPAVLRYEFPQLGEDATVGTNTVSYTHLTLPTKLEV